MNTLEARQKAQILSAIRELGAAKYERLADKLEMLDRQPQGKAGFWDAVLWLAANDPFLQLKLSAIETIQE